jgi:hypothetical protein
MVFLLVVYLETPEHDSHDDLLPSDQKRTRLGSGYGKWIIVWALESYVEKPHRLSEGMSRFERHM